MNFGGSKKKIFRQQTPQKQIVKVYIPLRIKSNLTAYLEHRSTIKSRLMAKLSLQMPIKSKLFSNVVTYIKVKSSLNAKISKTFTLKGQQDYKKFFDLLKIVEMLD